MIKMLLQYFLLQIIATGTLKNFINLLKMWKSGSYYGN